LGGRLGARFDVAAVAAAVGKSRLVVMRQLISIQRYHGLVQADQQAFAFAHTRIQQVLYDDLPQPLGAEYHLSLAEAIEGRWAAIPRARPTSWHGITCEAASRARATSTCAWQRTRRRRPTPRLKQPVLGQALALATKVGASQASVPRAPSVWAACC
jgi:hypothetical protein